MIPIAVGVKEHLIYLLFRRELEVILCESCESIFLVQISWIVKLRFEEWPL